MSGESIRHVRRLAERIARRAAQLPPVIREVVDVIGADVGRRRTLSELANGVGRSPSHLNMMFQRATRLTVRQYAVFVRMSHAATLIERGEKIEAVAISVGYRSKKNFYRQFKAWFGVNPTDLRVVRRA